MTEVENVAVEVAAHPQMSEEARAKQAETMRQRWQDPEYRARVAAGRAAKKAEREAAQATEAGEAVEAEQV